ncbi:MAG: hypothetical protein AAB597_03510 [Patescibacteria group bacterium]
MDSNVLSYVFNIVKVKKCLILILMDSLKDNPNNPILKADSVIGSLMSFKDKPDRIFLIKKTERLVAAAHILSEHLGQEEPLRRRIREASLSLLIEAGSPASPGTFESRATDLIALLEVSAFSRYLSYRNAELLSREISELVRFASEKSPSLLAGKDIDEKALFLEEPLSRNKDFSKGHLKGQNISVLYEPNSSKMNKKVANGHKVDSEREVLILEFLKQNKDAAIKDLKNIVPGVSEKTIQRDLVSLVERKVLKKEGERRWSRYSLIIS